MALPIVIPDWVSLGSDDRTKTHPILVAEDDPEMERLLCETLRATGRTVLSHGSGQLLLKTLERARELDDPPSLIVTDLRMPGPSGLDVAYYLRRGGWSVPVILISAFADGAVLDRAEAFGVHKVFSKPFDLDELLASAIQILEGNPGSSDAH